MGGPFDIIALTPAGAADPSIAIAASRAGCCGVYNAELAFEPEVVRDALDRLAKFSTSSFGLKVHTLDHIVMSVVREFNQRGLETVIVDSETAYATSDKIAQLKSLGCRVLLEITRWDESIADFNDCAAFIVKGNEAGGKVGEESTFVLLQTALNKLKKPVFARGGIGFHSAAAIRASGAAGIVLDNQLLLIKESSCRTAAQQYLKNFTGLETTLLRNGSAGGWRVLHSPMYRHVDRLQVDALELTDGQLRDSISSQLGWTTPTTHIIPLGQDAVFAREFSECCHTFGGVAREIEIRTKRSVAQAHDANVLGPGTGVSISHGTAYPIVQGPMTRVSDTAAFAHAVAENGALPMLALALMKPSEVDKLLEEVSSLIKGRPWGVGLLGFAPTDLIEGQIAVVRKYDPSFALIAGGRPGQAKDMDAQGINSYLHVPTPNLLSLFVEQGAARFVFEGRECGGHVGPLSSFVLWDQMVATLLRLAPDLDDKQEIQILFAGGIHDARSAAMVAALAAPLEGCGVKIGVLMGTAYIFTKEIVDGSAVVPAFQEQALACTETVTLETGPGHASRCALTPFAQQFLARKRELVDGGKSSDEIRDELESLTLGRLRVATKAKGRTSEQSDLQEIPIDRQAQDGMYMIGQVAAIVKKVGTIADLHASVSKGAHDVLAAALNAADEAGTGKSNNEPLEIAVIGVGGMFPKAGNVREFWENILDRVDGISEIPAHRWDWRLYFDEDRSKPDKIYSKWGGFLEDVPFDPMRYGIPPMAIKAVDPLQLMTLEVIRQCLDDAGYGDRDFDRERASIILGASGGAGDVGAQYAVRAEVPRFSGELDPDTAERLPKWTEDSFAGILLNVAAGRAANRFDFHGINYTVDAACASSLAAVYQGAIELKDRRSDLVIVGGVDTVQGPFGYLCFSKTQALSPRGRCSTFNTDADGIVISEGIAMIALKRLADAERDGDRIYAVLKGVGGSSDGRAKSMTAPLPDGQIRALARAYELAGYSPSEVELFEAHGTGTVAGDTAELETVTRLLGEAGSSPRQSAIGSVKTLIGHTKATAGVAGLIKTILACHHKVLPPHGRVEQPNPKLADPESPLYLNEEARPWIANAGRPRRGAVSAFGFGGTNFHVTLEEYRGAYLETERMAARQRWSHELLVWSGSNREDLVQSVRRTAEQLRASGPPELRDLAYTLACRTTNEGVKAAMVVAGSHDLVDPVSTLADKLANENSKLPPGAFFSENPLLGNGGKVALIFAGQGSQYPDMFRETAILFPELGDALSIADDILRDRVEEKGLTHGRLSRLIYPTGNYSAEDAASATEQLTRTDIAQPALAAIEAGLWQLLRRLGVVADMAAGHSFGEFVALHAAGVFDFENLLRVAESRGRYMVEAAEGSDLGTMAAVRAARETVEQAISKIGDVCIANHNSPSQTIISGTRAAVDESISKLEANNLAAKRLPVGAAFHSPIVAPAQARLAAFISGLNFNRQSFSVFTNNGGTLYPAEPGDMRDVLVRQLASPVEFVAEVEAMYEAGGRVFVSVGPKSIHAGLVRDILGDRPNVTVSTDDETGGLKALLKVVATLLAEGAPLHFDELFKGRDCRVVDLDEPTSVTYPPHIWMLNGSGARRVGDPVVQPLTVEDVAEKKAGSQSAAPIGTATWIDDTVRTVADTKEVSKRPSGNNGGHIHMAEIDPERDELAETERKEVFANVSYNGNSGERETVLAEYGSIMRQFLQTQENIMLAYLNGSPPQNWPEPKRALGIRRPQAPALSAMRQNGSSNQWASPAESMSAHSTGNGAGQGQLSRDALEAKSNGVGHQTTRFVPVDGGEEAGSSKGQAAPKPNGNSNGVQQHEHTAPNLAVPADTEPPPDSSSSAGLDPLKVTDQLLALVEERTGYPRDMLGMKQNIEADLGIDSIKRVEIVGALLKTLPLGSDAAELGEALNGEKTLQGIVDRLAQHMNGAVEGAQNPFELTGAGEVPLASRASLPRFVLKARTEDAATVVPRPLKQGLYMMTDDGTGVSQVLAHLISQQGGRTLIIDPAKLSFDEVIEQVLSASRSDTVAGFLHLAPLSAPRIKIDSPLSNWLDVLERNEWLPYALLQKLATDLQNGGHIIFATELGGDYARGTKGLTELSVSGGAVGLAKSLKQEWPDCAIKSVDFQEDASPSSKAEWLLKELTLPGGRIEVGYRQGARTVFGTVSTDLDASVPPRFEPGRDWVVLATGGARGITAETLRPFAEKGVTLILVGRTPFPAEEPAALSSLSGPDEIRRNLIAAMNASDKPVMPAEIERQLQTVLRDREIRSNIKELASIGGNIHYRVADMRDDQSIEALLADVYREFGRIDGVIHGAGIIEDCLFVDKSPDSWSRVVGTKIEGAASLIRHLRAQDLKFLVFFSSVAGRYGNAGQSDYAAANELLNRLACQLNGIWSGRTKLVSLNWGPWEATQFGSGMVSAETKKKFESKGVRLITPQAGARVVMDELLFGPSEEVEIVVGAGPWEEHENDIGAFADHRPETDESRSPATGPLIATATCRSGPKGSYVLRRRIDPDIDLYLRQHLVDGQPVLPAAIAVEMMAEAAAQIWPRWHVVEIADVRVLNGVLLEDNSSRDLDIIALGSGHGSAEGFRATMEIRPRDGVGPPHYRATVVLSSKPLEIEDYQGEMTTTMATLSARDAYNKLLFHGPCFQVATNLAGLDETGVVADLSATSAAEFIRAGDGAKRWIFDPGLIDCGPQMALVWSMQTRSEAALPSRFGRIRRYGQEPIKDCRMYFTLHPDIDEHQVVADVDYVDTESRLRMTIQGLECTSSRQLNRICGYEGEIRV